MCVCSDQDKMDWAGFDHSDSVHDTHADDLPGIWFVWYAYDQVFSRMPCGAYQFFLVLMLDQVKGSGSSETP